MALGQLQMQPDTSSFPQWKINFDVLPYLEAFRTTCLTADLDIYHSIKEHSIPLTQAAAFINYLDQVKATDGVISRAAVSFEQSLLLTTDIHSLATRLDVTAREGLIQAYFRISAGRRVGTKSTLLNAAKDGRVSLLAVFGGQGTQNPTCLEELRTIYRTYKPLVEDLINSAASVLKRIAEIQSVTDDFSTYGFDLIRWLQQPETAPRTASLATAPVSLPINGLISFAHYSIACYGVGMHPGQFRDALSGTTGHSQGIIVAAAIAGSDTWETFIKAVEDAVELLFWIGWESHHGTPGSRWLGTSLYNEDNHLEFTTSMLNVRGMKKSDIQCILKECNALLSDDEKAYLALINSEDSVVISGPTKTVQGIRTIIAKRSAPSGLEQNRVPFPHRRPVVDCQFLPISAAFHSPHLEKSNERILGRISADLFACLNLTIPVYHTRTGEDIRLASRQDLVSTLVRAIVCEPVDWPKACIQESITHILDFGPGKTSMFAHNQINGMGFRIIIASETIASSESMGGKHEVFSQEEPIISPNWAELYGPKLFKDGANRIHLITRMSQILGSPPIMVAGMTPTTMAPDFVSCVMNAGYHIELAGGGYSQAEDFERAVKLLAASIPVTWGITCNLIYAKPRAIAWQIPLIRRLQTEGLPIEGLTIGAGVPSPDIAKEYIETLGLRHISFKPSSVDSIRRVLDIARLNPSFPIMLQWTGGRAGGHHSYDDLHRPILETYGFIRKHSNIILIVGSGFGDAEGMLPYLTGQWALSFGYARMPFDGVLLGSRMMVAKEAHTSLPVKELIVETPGVADAEWHETYSGAAGGVITVKSEMGEPIHKVANRATMLWSDLDKTIFNVKDVKKRLNILKERRIEIISRLNQDYAKPWFAMSASGNPLDIEDMTYAECLQRITALMYMHQQQQWVHPSYQSFFFDFVSRVQERFNIQDRFHLDASLSPLDLLDNLLTVCPATITDFIYPEDVAFFIAMCKRRDQKPVNFIPALNDDFETWFKKDSLWQMEKLEAVTDQDPQQVCIIHGPVAAKFSTSVDESAADILNKIYNDLVVALTPIIPISKISEHDIGQFPLCVQPEDSPTQMDFVDIVTRKTQLSIQVDCQFKEPLTNAGTRQLLQKLHFGANHWLNACLTSEHVFVGRDRRPNRVLAAFLPRVGDILRLEFQQSKKVALSMTLLCSIPGRVQCHPTLSLSSSDGKIVNFKLESPTILTNYPSAISLDLALQHERNRSTLHDITEHREAKIANFYASCWSIDYNKCVEDMIGSSFSTDAVVLSAELVDNFVSLISRARGNNSGSRSIHTWAPLDLGIIVAWKALSRPLLNKELGGDLSCLLHGSNAFEIIPGASPLKVGDSLETLSRITAITLKPQGKLVEVTAVIRRHDAPVMKITSEFFIQGQFPHLDMRFRISEEPDFTLSLDSPKLVALLLSRHWFKPDAECPNLLGKTLLFKIHSKKFYGQSSNLFELNTSGMVSQIPNEGSSSCIGHVSFSHPSCYGNPVVDFLQRYGSSMRQMQRLELPGWYDDGPWLLHVHNFGHEYSSLSMDRNPIHTSPVFAGFAGLSAPIVHGMYTSAIVRNAIEERLAGTDYSRFRRWYTSFEDIVRGGDVLRIEIQHNGMIAGNMVFKIEVWNNETNVKVLNAEAEVEQAPTVYLFCGQGCQEQGMGMELYNSDHTAKSIWDRADHYLFHLYG